MSAHKMNPEIAQAAMQFMGRVQLRGEEVPAFNAVMDALHGVANPNDGTPDPDSNDTDGPVDPDNP